MTFSKRKPRPLGRGPSDSQTRTTAGLRLSGVGYGGKHDGRKHGRLDWVPAGRESVEPKQQPLPDCACPLWHTGQAGRWHGLCAPGPKGPGAGVSALPRGRTGRTPQGDSATAKRRSRNTPDPTRDSRSAHTPQAVPLPPPGRKPRGRGRVAVKTLASDGPDPRTVLPGAMAAPTPRVGTPALKSGEDVKAQMSPTAKGTVETPEMETPGVAMRGTPELGEAGSGDNENSGDEDTGDGDSGDGDAGSGGDENSGDGSTGSGDDGDAGDGDTGDGDTGDRTGSDGGDPGTDEGSASTDDGEETPNEDDGPGAVPRRRHEPHMRRPPTRTMAVMTSTRRPTMGTTATRPTRATPARPTKPRRHRSRSMTVRTTRPVTTRTPPRTTPPRRRSGRGRPTTAASSRQSALWPEAPSRRGCSCCLRLS